MYTVFSILIIITSIILVLVVLVQNPKGGGLSSSFGGGAGNQIMGAKKTTDFLEKATWRLAIILIILSLASSFILKSGTNTNEAVKEIKGPELIDQAPAVPNLPNLPSAE